MVRNRVKKRTNTWTDDNLKQALKDLKEGKSIRDAADANNVNRETLRRHSKKVSGEGIDNDFKIDRNFNFKAVFTGDEEATLVKYLLQCSWLGYGLTPLRCRKVAYALAVKNGKDFPAKWHLKSQAGKDWMNAFLKRHPELSLRKGEGCSLGRAVSFNKNTVAVFFSNLEDLYKKYPEIIARKRLYNLDETGTTTVNSARKLISQRGQKQVSINTSGERGTLVTTCVIVSAKGELLPPAMIFPRVKFQMKMTDGAYPETLGLVNLSGWMTSNLFIDVMKHFIKHSGSSKENQSILIMDGHESHTTIEVIDLAKENGVHLLTLPPHSSHRMQPLDVTFFGPFKTYYNEEMGDWMINNPGKIVTIHDIAPFVHRALVKAGTVDNIVNGFRTTGISPFNRNIFKDEDFVQSTINYKPTPDSDTPLPDPSSPGESVSTSLGVSVQSENNSNGEPVNNSFASSSFAGPEEIFGLPKVKAGQIGNTVRKGRKKKSAILTSTPIQNEIRKEKEQQKNVKKKI